MVTAEGRRGRGFSIPEERASAKALRQQHNWCVCGTRRRSVWLQLSRKLGRAGGLGLGGGSEIREGWEVAGGGVIPQSLVGCCKDFGICSESRGSHGAF